MLYQDVLVWPEGNQFLSAKLEKEISNHLKTEYLTYRIERSEMSGTALYMMSKIKKV